MDEDEVARKVIRLETQFENIYNTLKEIKGMMEKHQSASQNDMSDLRRRIDNLDDKYADIWVQKSFKKLVAGLLSLISALIVAGVAFLV